MLLYMHCFLLHMHLKLVFHNIKMNNKNQANNFNLQFLFRTALSNIF